MERILDNEFFHGWGAYVTQESDILWEGKPDVPVSISTLETDNHNTSGLPIGGLIITWVIGFIYAKHLFDSGDKFFAIALILIVIIGPFFRDFLFHYKISKAEYAITKQFILFKRFNGYKYKIYAIPYADLLSVSLIGKEENKGTLLLVTANEPEFKTYNVMNKERRDHISIEMVEDSEIAHSIIKENIKSNPPRKLVYQEHTISTAAKGILKAMFLILLLVLAAIGIQVYLLPSFEGELMTGLAFIHGFFFLCCLVSLSWTCFNFHKKKIILMDKVFQMIAVNVLLIILYLIIFNVLS